MSEAAVKRRALLRTAAVVYPVGAVCIFAASASSNSVQAELGFGISYDCFVISAGVLVQVSRGPRAAGASPLSLRDTKSRAPPSLPFPLPPSLPRKVAELGCTGEVKWARAAGLFVWFVAVFVADCPSSLILLTNTAVLAGLLAYDVTPRGGGAPRPPPPPRAPRPWAMWALIAGVVLAAAAVLARFVSSVVTMLSEAEMAYAPSPAPARAGGG